MSQNHPREPRSELRTAAAAVHEIYIALVEQGFREDQALKVVATMLVGATQSGG